MKIKKVDDIEINVFNFLELNRVGINVIEINGTKETMLAMKDLTVAEAYLLGSRLQGVALEVKEQIEQEAEYFNNDWWLNQL